MCVFSNFINVALGDASMEIVPSGYPDYPRALVVSNLGEGWAGVRQYVDSFDMETRLQVPNFSLSAPGNSLVGLQRGVVDGVPDQVFSEMTITNSGDGLTVNGDWSPINPSSYRIDIYLGDELVASESGLATGEFLIEDIIDIWIIDCRTPTHLTGTIHGIPTAPFTIPGRGTFIGDNWVISAMGFDRIAVDQREIDMLANFAAFGILDENTMPGPVMRDCNSNALPDYGEAAAGLADDENDNQIPDECEQRN